ncbi:MAG: deoxyribodipyrimidine photo-lyase [Streptosporangiaceae bacterium]|jgi:deoxyribodipyrimidine photo-lyase
MQTAIAVFTRDLRMHDNPALATACAKAERVLPVFVADPRLMTSPSRTRFLAEALAELRDGLRQRGGDLVIRHGEPVAEVLRLAAGSRAQAIFIADDVSRYAVRRRGALAAGCASQRIELVVTPGLTVVPPGELRPADGDHYKVFTPYWRAWTASTWRAAVPAPGIVRLPAVAAGGRAPAAVGSAPAGLLPGGEQAGRTRAQRWLGDSLACYGERHDDLAGDQTSRLGAYLRFGCLSPLELAVAARGRPGGEEFCRQLAWRDFFYQVTAAVPDMARTDYRSHGETWRDDPDALAAWREGRTGVPIVDAGMRQLAAEGFMHNRARMITASFLTRDLRIDWRHGYRHFFALLADGDVASNAGNWQWVAGTGNNTRRGRVLNMQRQARRFDPAGDYVRRYVPELAGLDAAQAHAPWQLGPGVCRRLGYPAPIIEPGPAA